MFPFWQESQAGTMGLNNLSASLIRPDLLSPSVLAEEFLIIAERLARPDARRFQEKNPMLIEKFKMTKKGSPFANLLWLLPTLLCLSSGGGFAEVVELKNPLLCLRVDKETSLVQVADLKTGTVYEQVPDFDMRRIKDVAVVVHENGLAADVAFTFDKLAVVLRYRLAPDSPVVDVTLDADPEEQIKTVTLPVPFTVSGKGFEWVLPEGYGMLFKVDDPELPERSPNMIAEHCAEWAGLFQPQTGEGYTLIIKDFYHGAFFLKRRDINGRSTLVPELSFGGYLGKFAEPRSVKFIFQQEGGYVNIALNFRKHLMETGHYRSLEDKQKDNPAIAKLRGAPIFWIYPKRSSEAEGVLRVLGDMVSSGMDKGILALGFNFYMSPDDVKRIQENFNYVVGIYDNYFDVLPKEWFAGADDTKMDWIIRYNRIGRIPERVAQNEKGELRFTTGPNAKRYTGSPAKSFETAKERLDAELPDYQFTYRFFDVTPGAALWLDQDFNPENPVTPKQSMEARLRVFKLFCDAGMILGGEGGDAWTTPYFTVSEGGMSVYHMVGRLDPVEPNADFKNFNMSPQKRVPVNGIVYGDARVATWAWGDNYVTQPDYMLTKDLFNILYGTAPSYHFDIHTYGKNRDKILESYNRVVPVYEKLFGAALVNHRWLTPDRSVQQTEFSNGWMVAVNFGGSEFALNDGVKIAPMGFHMWLKTPAN